MMTSPTAQRPSPAQTRNQLGRSNMSTHSVSEVIDRDRRHLLSNAAMGIAAVTAASLLPAFPSHAAASTEIRPFHMNFPEEALIDLRRRVSGTEAAVTLDPDGQGFK